MKANFLPITFLLLCISAGISAQPHQEIISTMEFRNIGPAFMSGRISDIEKAPDDASTWHVAVASGNVWKTVNNGTTWKPVFENYGSYSTACIAIDPNNSQVIWLGTGENQSQRSVGWGDGVYKSLDGGKSWTNVGLKNSEHIGKILIDPRNSNVIYVAAQGPLWSAGGQRGVYKTNDGGKSWTQILNISKETGVSDLAFDPGNPDIIYATSYQRRRHVGILVAGGPESRIYKTVDGGANWKQLSKGLPDGELGRIALAVSPQKSNVVYALIAGTEQQSGFYRSEDYGESWTKKNDYIVVDPQYYGEIFADPHRFDHVYAMDVIIHYTEDGGNSFKRLNSRFKHVDNHDLVFDANDPDYLMVGCDGGIYESWDRGDSWTYHSNLPITQFYRVGLDNEQPFYNVYGGTQDNSTLYGPARSTSRHGITNSDWKLALGGDGFQARVDPDDPNIVYCQFQYAGIVRYDRRTGQRLEIQPQPAPEDAPLRWHWDSPLIISPHNSKRLYYAAQKLYRSDDRGDSWHSVSNDLSRGENRNLRPVMGKIWSPEAIWKNVFTSPFGTIVSLSESPIAEGLIVVGTDDGLIQITEDGGQNWKRVEHFPGVPDKTYVADVLTSKHDRKVIYAVFNNHKEGDFKPYFARSSDLGSHWQLITNGLDSLQAGWSIVEDHQSPDLLFAATEFGLFCSFNAGQQWIQMKGALPTIAFRDLEIQQRENDLVAASFGRGMFILDDYSLLRNVSTVQSTTLFPVKPVKRFFQRGDYGGSEKGSFGDNFFTAPNPPYGAVFSIYLADNFLTKKEQRKKAEQTAAVIDSYPDPLSLKMEDMESPPAVFIRITDDKGELAGYQEVKNVKGFQRVTWDLHPEYRAPDGESKRQGPEVADGSYTAELLVRDNGQLTGLAPAQRFEVSSLSLSPEKPANDRFEFFQKAALTLLEAQTLEEKIKKELEKMQVKQLQYSKNKEADSLRQLQLKRMEMLNLQYDLLGDQSLERRFEYFLPGVTDRLRRVYSSHQGSDQITQTQRQNFEMAKSRLLQLKVKFEEIIKHY